MATWTRSKITAEQIKVGDRVSRLKRGPYHEVTALSNGESAVWISFEGAGRVRPSHTTELWVEVDTTAADGHETESPSTETKNAPAATAAAPQASKAVAEKVAWPKAPAVMLVNYLKAEVTDAPDAPNRSKPFINEAGIVHLHSTDWRTWLAAQGMELTKSQAAEPLRDAGLKVRAFPLPGEGRSLGFYIGQAPKGTEKLPRRKGGRTAAPARPFGKLTPEQREVLLTALTAHVFEAGPLADARDELVAQLPDA